MSQSNLLWQKSDTVIDHDVQHFLAGEDVLLDRHFLQYDITASQIHAECLRQIGVLSEAENAALQEQLCQLSTDFQTGQFVLDSRYEDGHSAIESRLTDRLGDTGGKIHTGRSRNDQILVATRLWLKDQLHLLAQLCGKIAAVALDRIQQEGHQPLPGYTHLQRAVVSSLGMWWSSWAEAFLDNAQRALDTHRFIDCNPLGTAAGYGVNLPLDRDKATQALGFSRLQLTPGYAQLSRGKFEIASLDALSGATLDLRRLAWDLSLFTSQEFQFVTLPSQYTTGSSIMPNKRNPDVVELLRAAHACVSASRLEIEQLLSLPSGYHRDLQQIKGAMVRGFSRGMAALRLLPDLLITLNWSVDRLHSAIDSSLYATDFAIETALTGMPFRQAYAMAASHPEALGEGRTPQKSLRERVSPGAAGNLQLDQLDARYRQLIHQCHSTPTTHDLTKSL